MEFSEVFRFRGACVPSVGCSFIMFGSINASEVSKCALLLNSPHNSVMMRQII